MTTIKLCGRLQVRLDGREVALPGRQGRAVFAYLVVNRRRAVPRDELLDLLWPAAAPADPGETLSALLSRVRRALGPEVLVGKKHLGLALAADAWIDFAVALDAADRAEAALDRGDPSAARDAAREALDIAEGGFLTGDDLPWVEECRRELAELRLRALEALAAAGAALGGAGLAAAERAARELVHTAPFRESGHRLLMAALAARGDVAEALRVYEDLRCLLRDELGAVPGRAVVELHERLLSEERFAGPTAEPPGEEAPPAPPPRDERKVVTVLVAELAGLAGDRGDPEALLAAIAPRAERLREEIERFGGTVEQFVGSVAIAVFGLRRTREDDPERSVAAAARICAAGEPSGAQPLAARAGLATGEVLVSPGGPQAEPLAGDVVTSALRLQDAAPTGAVLVDQSTYRATGTGVDYEQFDGAWRVTSLRPARRRSAPTPLVGRSHELGVMKDLYLAGVEDERPRLVTVLGSAGVGKTRLVEEFMSRAAAGPSPPAVHRGRCLSYGEGITYWALREIIWGAAGIVLGDTSAAAAAKLIGLVRRLLKGPDADRAARALAIGSGISLLDNPLKGTSPESIAEELGLAWPMFLTALAAERPTIVVLEDLHWAEPPLLDMLERILSRSSGRLLLVVTARPELVEARPGWSFGPGRSQLALEPLTDAQTGALLTALLPAADPGLREAVARAAEGNPFFAEEIVAHLGDRTMRAAGRPAPDELTRVAIPGTVRAVLAARIDALPEAEKLVLQDASVVGRTFWATTLESMGADASIRPSLRALEEKGLVFTRPESALPDHPELSFRHTLIREVAYRSVPRRRRCQAHASVADWLERLAGDRRGEFVDLLAHHYEAAANPADAALAWSEDAPEREDVRAKAVQALVDAGWAARQRFQTEQALRYAGRTLALARDDAERLAALELEAAALHAAVRADDALASYLEALRLARSLGASERVSRLRAEATLLCSRYVGAFSGPGWERAAAELVEQGLAELGEQRVDFETGALLIGRVSAPRWLASPPSDTLAARRDARRAIEIAEAIDSPYLLAAAYHALYKIVIADGLCECEQVAQSMQRAAQRMRDRVEAHEGLVVASTSFFWAGRFEAAQAASEQAVAESAALSPHRRLHAVCVQAICLGTDGRILEALEATAEVPDLIRGDGGHTCPYGALALARRAVSLFEVQERQAADAAVELLRRAAPRQRAAAFVFRAAELLRPFVGLEATSAFLETIGGRPLDRVDDVNRLRLELQVRALGTEPAGLDRLIVEARESARPACAPFLGWLADWAQAVALIRSGAVEEGLPLARSATSELDAYGERYTAARLLVDLLPWLDAPAAEEVAAHAAARLETMGAHASAAQARSGRLSSV